MTREIFLEDSYETRREVNIVDIQGNKIELDQTIFYPTGGGQEHDTGTLQQGERSVEVNKVKKENGKIYHYVSDTALLEVGSVVAELDWERRHSLMRHHSMLHVVGSVFHKHYGSLCTGNQIYQDRARIDLTEITDIGADKILEMINEANKQINAEHVITQRVLPREEAENISGTIKTVVNLIPKSVKEIRLIKIGDIDEQACGGTHVKNTKEIGEISLEKTKNKGKGVVRLELKIS
jgi:misacylated tRNA(Ala) deacylase